MANVVWNKWKDQVMTGSDIWTSSSVYGLLVDSSSTYTFNDTHDHLSDFTGNGGVELSTTGYTANGKALTTKALTRDDVNHVILLTADPLAWPALGVVGKTVKALLLYLHTGTPSTSDLIAYFDSIGGVPLDGSDETWQWELNRVMVLS